MKKELKTTIFLSLMIFAATKNAFAADTKFSEPEFLELVNTNLIDADLQQILKEIEEDTKALEEAEKTENITAKNENPQEELVHAELPADIPHEESEFVPKENEVAEAEAVIEEEPTPPEILTEIGGLEVDDSEYTQGMIRKYMSMYTTERGKQTLYHVLDSGSEYRIFIRHKLIEYGLPRALEYLPVVESEYTITATSRSGAKGLWQFMENSIKPYLKKNDWIDERLDPWKSTEAALKKLQENYKTFNDWALALAAYNCGAGAMKKIIKAHPDMTFWQLAEAGYLKNQTVHYVPKLLGITELCEKMEKYNIELPTIADDYDEIEYDYAIAKKPINLAKLAKELSMTTKEIKKLNPSLIRTVTPPSTGYQVRLPKGMLEQGQLAIDTIQKNMKGDALLYTEHKISSGDTLWALSRAYGCKVDDICDLNGISQRSILKLGKVLYIPLR